MIGRPNVEKLLARRDVAGLIKALAHTNPATRRDAATALGSLGDTGAWNGDTPAWALARLLGGSYGASSGEREPAVRMAAIEAWGLLASMDPLSPSGLDAILDQATAENHEGGQAQIVDAAVAAIERVADAHPAAIDGLIDGQLRAYGWYGSSLERKSPASLVALGRFGARWLLTSEAEPSVLKVDRPSLLAAFGDAAVDECRQALTHPEPRTRIRAVQGLAYMTQDIRSLTSVAGSDDDRAVRQCAIAELGEIGGPHAYDAIAQLLSTADRELRLAIIKPLTRTGDPRSVEALIALTKDEDPAIRWRAARSLAYLLEAHRSDAFPERLRQVLADEAIDRVIFAIVDAAPDVPSVENLNIKPRSLGKKAVALARAAHGGPVGQD